MEFEKIFIRMATEYCDRLNISEAELARSCFPENTRPQQKWNRIKIDGQSLTLVDFIRISEFMRKTLKEVVLIIEDEMGFRQRGKRDLRTA